MPSVARLKCDNAPPCFCAKKVTKLITGISAKNGSFSITSFFHPSEGRINRKERREHKDSESGLFGGFSFSAFFLSAIAFATADAFFAVKSAPILPIGQ